MGIAGPASVPPLICTIARRCLLRLRESVGTHQPTCACFLDQKQNSLLTVDRRVCHRTRTLVMEAHTTDDQGPLWFPLWLMFVRLLNEMTWGWCPLGVLTHRSCTQPSHYSHFFTARWKGCKLLCLCFLRVRTWCRCMGFGVLVSVGWYKQL